MRVRHLCFAVSAIAVSLVSGNSAAAQSPPCVAPGIIGTISYGIQSAKAGVPFTGVVKTTFEQRLADGNAIHSVTRVHQARDSSGKTMMERAEGCVRGEDGQMHERLLVTVNDRATRTDMTWQAGWDDMAKVVHIFHQPDPPSRPIEVVKRPEPSPTELERRQRAIHAAQLQQREYRTEDLGTRDFNGVSAKGTRNTRTIPAGEEGNDQPLVVVDETWRSREMGLTLMAINDDPRRGRSTMEYEELNRVEPDPALFAAPAGYTVQEQHQNGAGAILQ
jgi:hypothetical protein